MSNQIEEETKPRNEIIGISPPLVLGVVGTYRVVGFVAFEDGVEEAADAVGVGLSGTEDQTENKETQALATIDEEA
jgi:hypothetical protein